MKFQLRKSALLAASVIAAGTGISTPALSQLALEEIIVTARRVEENIQDVPISISTFEQSSLDNNNIFSGNELGQVVPSLNVYQRYGPENTKFAIRGVVQEDRTPASVAVYFADVVSPRGAQGLFGNGDGAGPGAFFDLQNVQVLKGPQGTLFGRNTTGGAVLLVPQKPTEELDGYVEGSLGNFGMTRAQGVINIPISDTIRFRAGLDSMQRDGYMDNISGVGPSEFADVDYTAGRMSLIIDLADNLENYTIASFSTSENNGNSGRIEDWFPGRVTGFGASAREIIEGPLAGTDVWTVYSNAARETGFQQDPTSELDTWQIINTTTWEVSDALTVKNIISYAELEAFSVQDPYGTSHFKLGTTFNGIPVAPQYQGKYIGFATLQGLNSVADQYTFTEEFRVEGLAMEERLQWQAGLYYENSDSKDPSGTAGQSGGVACDDVLSLECEDVLGAILGAEGAIGSFQWQDTATEITNIGVYAQASFDITEKLGATAGIRYTKDETDTLAHLGFIRFPDANTPALYCTSSSGPFGPATPGDYSNAIASGQADVLAKLNTGDFCAEPASQKSDEPTWTLGLDYNITDDVMVYGSYTKGYRQGATNPFGALGFQTYEPEDVDVYELGAKTSWEGNVPGYFNISVFNNDFQSIQVTAAAVDLAFTIAPNSFITNGEGETSGFEIDTGVTFAERVNVGLNYSYVDSELESINIPTAQAGGLYNLFLPVSTANESMVLSPENRYTLTASYLLPIDEALGEMELGLTYSYTDDQWSTYASKNIEAGLMPEYDLLNLNFSWSDVAGSNFDLALFGTNVLDEEYKIVANERVSSGFNVYTYGAPAMYGMRVRYNFE